MRILEITNYTAGGCGIGMRVLKESQLLAERGHEVTIFSTNKVKGSPQLCPPNEKQDKVNIKRFSAVKLGGESFMNWEFTHDAIKYNPDVIIAHAYRHPHTTQALKIAKKLGCRVFLVTHAPFARERSRNIIGNLAVTMYDLFIGRNKIKQFTKIITITEWERKHLYNLGVNPKQIVYIPNGIPQEFFKPFKKINSLPSSVVFLGRIAPIKQLENLIDAVSMLKGNYSLEIRGPAEKDYFNYLKDLIRKNNAGSFIKITDKQYTKYEQISILDHSEVYVLPSKTEGLPQTLIEAMSRGKIVVASINSASNEIISHEKNGFLYSNGNAEALYSVLKNINSLGKSKLNALQDLARLKAEKFRWTNLIKSLEKTIK